MLALKPRRTSSRLNIPKKEIIENLSAQVSKMLFRADFLHLNVYYMELK